MHPALSVITFTTLSGAGYGLAVVLGLLQPDPALTAIKVGRGLALIAIAGGLVSSTLHLRNPQRAWRAFSQWRSSWLSREGVRRYRDLCAADGTNRPSVLFDLSFDWLGYVGAVWPLSRSTAPHDLCLAENRRSLAQPVTTTGYLLFALSGEITCPGRERNAVNELGATIIVLAVRGAGSGLHGRGGVVSPLGHESGPSTPESATGLGVSAR